MNTGKIKVILLAFSSILIIVSLSMVAAVLFAGTDATENGLISVNHLDTVEFTCHAGSKYAFIFPVKVDLSDGMDSNESIVVARSLYEFNMNQTNYDVKSVQSNDDGSWTVFLFWGSVSASGELENHSHYYNVHVNATDRTVDYDRCY